MKKIRSKYHISLDNKFFYKHLHVEGTFLTLFLSKDAKISDILQFAKMKDNDIDQRLTVTGRATTTVIVTDRDSHSDRQ